MCAGNDHPRAEPTASGRDEWYVDSPAIRAFIEQVRATAAAEPDRARVTDRLRPAFAAVLADTTWLPPEYARPDLTSGMGGGIGQYLLFRAGDGSLSLFSLVVPSGSSTPVHDHLAWGLIGLFQGQQAEEIYGRHDDGSVEGYAELRLTATRVVDTGDFYALLPPDGDIHRVRTTSAAPSISIHLLGNDTGCVWRHAYEPEARSARAFRSGYSNRPCAE